VLCAASSAAVRPPSCLRAGERTRAALQAAQQRSPPPSSLLMMVYLTCLQLCRHTPLDAVAHECARRQAIAGK